jgi:hypothetical protein
MKSRFISTFAAAVWSASAGLAQAQSLAPDDAENPGTQATSSVAQPTAAPAIQLLVRGDDLGSCHAANVASIAAYKNGIVRSVEVIVLGPWFLEAAALIAENPNDVDVPEVTVAQGRLLAVSWKNGALVRAQIQPLPGSVGAMSVRYGNRTATIQSKPAVAARPNSELQPARP